MEQSESIKERTLESFKKANRIMKDVVSMLPNISIVTTEDIPLFNSFFEEEFKQKRETHGNGFSYMIQMMNRIGEEDKPKLGYKYFDQKNLIPLVVYPKKTNGEEFALYFIRPMGEDALNKIIELTKILREKGFSHPIYVKKVFEDQKDFLLKNGFSPIEKLPWHPSAPSEDDTYPEMIFDIQLTLNSLKTFGRRRNLKTSYKQSQKLLEKYTISLSEENFEKAAWGITEEFFININEKKTNLSNSWDYYNLIFHNPSREGLERKILYLDGNPIAYYIMEKSHKDRYNLYALLSLREEFQYLSDLVLFKIFQKLEHGFINLGGSEDPGINNFKKKFNPQSQQQMYWVVNP
jgi:hypothetical protein